MSEIRTAAEAIEAAAEVGKEAAKTGDCHHAAAAIRALASRIPPAPDDEKLVEMIGHMRQMSKTARNYRLPHEDCDDLERYAAVLAAVRAGALR